MSAKVVLTVTSGCLKGQEYTFHDRTMCSVGRSRDCYLQLPDTWWHRNISRHHCLLDIDPPSVRVRDTGSKNGTFVNGEKIGQRLSDVLADDTTAPDQPDCPLHEGDELRIGDLIFQVGIVDESGDTMVVAGSQAASCTLA